MSVFVWPAGRTFTRSHPHLFGSTEFDARPAGSADARFASREFAGRLVPVLSGGVDDRTASAETIFGLLPSGDRPRRIRRSDYTTWQWSTVQPTRDLRLVALDATCPDAAALVDGTAPSFADSRDTATQLLAGQPDIDGLVWVSRQLHALPSTVTVNLDMVAVSLVLFGSTDGRTGGVERHELNSNDPSVLFLSTEGLLRLMRVGSELDVTVVIV